MLRRGGSNVNVRDEGAERADHEEGQARVAELQDRHAREPGEMCVCSDKFHLVIDGSRVDDGVGHVQSMADAEVGSRKGDPAVEIGNFPAQSFSDKFICNSFALAQKKNLSYFENDYSWND